MVSVHFKLPPRAGVNVDLKMKSSRLFRVVLKVHSMLGDVVEEGRGLFEVLVPSRFKRVEGRLSNRNGC